MKVLWFEISIPSRYRNSGMVTAGWQDSLEEIVLKCKDIQLFVAFESAIDDEVKVIDGITYIPMLTHYSWWEQKKREFTCKVNEEKVIRTGLEVIHQYKPDIIHVFGNEWPYGLLSLHTDIPLVIHIQGSIIPYYNALYPAGYSNFSLVRAIGCNLRKQYHNFAWMLMMKTCLNMETRIWSCVSHYMGRTEWDRALVNMLHPGAAYYHVEEALRPVFLKTTNRWRGFENTKLKLFTTGCSTFWKGIDMMLKTAHVLKMANVEFEWTVAGQLSDLNKKIIENKEGLNFSDYNFNFLGFTQPDKLIEKLCESTLYVHTAYIENSPNSICEAQILGVPVVSTMVGGISTLVRDKMDGILVPANDPWQMANAIVELSNDKERMKMYSLNTRKFAIQRHSKDNILNELISCYQDITSRIK